MKRSQQLYLLVEDKNSSSPWVQVQYTWKTRVYLKGVYFNSSKGGGHHQRRIRPDGQGTGGRNHRQGWTSRSITESPCPCS